MKPQKLGSLELSFCKVEWVDDAINKKRNSGSRDRKMYGDIFNIRWISISVVFAFDNLWNVSQREHFPWIYVTLKT